MFTVWVHLLRNLALRTLNRLSSIKCCIITGVSMVTRSIPKSIIFYRLKSLKMASIDPQIEMIGKPGTYHREQWLNWSSQEWVLTEDSDFQSDEWIGCALLTSATYILKATSRILQASILAQTLVYWCVWTAYRNYNSASLNYFASCLTLLSESITQGGSTLEKFFHSWAIYTLFL